jgi:hypothetical protein
MDANLDVRRFRTRHPDQPMQRLIERRGVLQLVQQAAVQVLVFYMLAGEPPNHRIVEPGRDIKERPHSRQRYERIGIQAECRQSLLAKPALYRNTDFLKEGTERQRMSQTNDRWCRSVLMGSRPTAQVALQAHSKIGRNRPER